MAHAISSRLAFLTLVSLAPLALGCTAADGDEGDDSTGGMETGGEESGGDFDKCAAVPEGMICIEAGAFTMGLALDPEASPVREVTLDTYWIDQLEASVSRYRACIDAGACTPPISASEYCNFNVAGNDEHPMNCISWDQATAFCEYEGKRLLTEAEWEKAAGGDGMRSYPWGDDDPSCQKTIWGGDPSSGNTAGNGCGSGGTFPVSATNGAGASPYGVWTMAGSLREWVADWSTFGYDPADTDNPLGAAEGQNKVQRGGDYTSNTGKQIKVTVRDALPPDSASNTSGVRCGKTPVPPM